MISFGQLGGPGSIRSSKNGSPRCLHEGLSPAEGEAAKRAESPFAGLLLRNFI